MERRPAVGSKCGVGILHVCQVKDHHQERSDNNIDCSPSHLAHYIKKTVTVRFILDHPVDIAIVGLYTKKKSPRIEGLRMRSIVRSTHNIFTPLPLSLLLILMLRLLLPVLYFPFQFQFSSYPSTSLEL